MEVRAFGRRWNAWRAASPYLADQRSVSPSESQLSAVLLSGVLAISLLLVLVGHLVAVSSLEDVGLGILCFFGIGTGFVQLLNLAALQAILTSVLLSCAILAVGGFVMARFQVWSPDIAISVVSGFSTGLSGAALRRLKRRAA